MKNLLLVSALTMTLSLTAQGVSAVGPQFNNNSPAPSFGPAYSEQRSNYDWLIYQQQLQQTQIQRRMLEEQEQAERNYQQERLMRDMQDSMAPYRRY